MDFQVVVLVLTVIFFSFVKLVSYSCVKNFSCNFANVTEIFICCIIHNFGRPFVWRVRGKIIRSVLCNIVCNNCAQCNAHTYEQITVLWFGFCLTGPISLCLDSFVYCVLLCVVCMLRFVTRWGGHGGNWSLPLGLLLPSVLWHCSFGHLTRKNPSTK